MNHVKTYELFGLFGKKKGVSKNVKSFLAHEKDEKSKKDKYEEGQRVAREKAEEADRKFKERIKSTIESISHPCIDRITVDASDSREVGRILVMIILDNKYLRDTVNDLKSRYHNLTFEDIELRNPILTMEFKIRPDYERAMYITHASKSGKKWDSVVESGRDKKEYMSIYHYNDSDEFDVWMKDIVDYKGNVSDESKLKHVKISHDNHHRRMMGSTPPSLSYESGQTDDVNLDPIKSSIISRVSEMGLWIYQGISDKIRNFERLREFEVISTFTDEEVKDYMSDLIDISDDYKIDRNDENILVVFDIPGLRSNHEGKMRMNRLNSQITKYLTEIQGRLEERELEISVEFGDNRLGIHIGKMENENPETKRMAKPGPRRAAP